MMVKYSNEDPSDATNSVSVNGNPATSLKYPYTGKDFGTVEMKVDLRKGYDNTI